jgi:plastocyanin
MPAPTFSRKKRGPDAFVSPPPPKGGEGGEEDAIMRIPLVAGAVAAGLTLGSCGLGGPAYQPPPPAVDAVVDMTTTLQFTPAQVTISPGQTVEWRNKSIMDHTVTADPRLAKNPANVALPSGAQAFHSGSIKPGQVYRMTFTVPGLYRYVCLPHEGQGMIGTVQVLATG